jgi:uridine kinase
MTAVSDSLSQALAAIAKLPLDRRTLVAVDGVDGAGKTTFADALAPLIDRPVVRASVDDFHNPQAIRYRRGRESSEGFYLDSFDLPALIGVLLAPFAAGRTFCRRAFDHERDTPVPLELEDAAPGATLLLDGLFLHRRQLRHWWDLSILLDVPPGTAAQRLLAREGSPTRDRYLRGQELYFTEADPRQHASLTVPW